MAEARFEMLWDCPACDTPKLLGLTHRHCPNCGAAQDPSRRYFPKDDEKVAVEGHPYQGVDRQCPACDSPNAARATFCVNCGSELDRAKAVGQRAEQSAAAGAFEADSAKAAAAEALAKKLAARAPAPPPPARSGIGLWLALAAGAAAVLLCAGLATFFLWKKDADFTLLAHTWSRQIAVEQLGPVTESAWRDAVPPDARDLSCAREQRSTTSVPDGEDCHDVRRDNGDGTFTQAEECTPRTREEPVYDDKCRYTVDRWTVLRTETASGTGVVPAPSWPAVQLGGPTLREGTRSETYTLSLRDGEGTETTCEVPEARWASMADGSTWRGKIGVLSGAVDCTTLLPR